ncbi:MAG TPA: hypothetical protein VD994_15970 [Prosthecobacter sp.]|nr:hypothetical protein [Prosthecobacter sp.]
MNRAFLTLLAISAMLPATVLAAIDKITTLTGKTYHRCEVVRVHPDGVSFTHSNGAAKVLFVDLPESWRKRLGYSPAKAAAHERDLADKRQRQAEARAEYQKQLARAMVAAQEAEATRLRIAEEQARAAIRAAELNALYAPRSAYPLLPAIGAVFDSRDYRYGRRSHDRRFAPYPYGYGNGIWYGLSSGYYPLNGTVFSTNSLVHPAPPPIGISFKKGSFSFQATP